MISFLSINANQRLPAVLTEVDSSKAQQGPVLLQYYALAIGQKLAAGTWAADSIQRCTSVEQAIIGGGRGSMIHRIALAWFAVNKSTPLWFGVLADDGGGTAATGTIVVAGPATGAGTIVLYIGGERVTVGVASGAISTAVATAIGAAINANLDLPVTASVGSSTVTLAYRHKGVVGNSHDVRHSFRDGEALPAGIGLTITAIGGVIAGTTNPSLTNLIAAAGDMWFQIWNHPYTDATSLTAIENELETRFGPARQQPGVAITSASGSFGTATTLGGGRNSKHHNIMWQPGANPLTPPVEFGAEAAGLIAKYGALDPARPFQTIAFARAIAPAENDLFSPDERNLMLFDGISPTQRAAGGVVQLERVITTYQTSPSGADDVAYLDLTTPLTLIYYRYSFRVQWQTKYPRHKLADDRTDGKSYGSGQAIVTPKIGVAEALAWFHNMETLGLIEGFEQFKRDLVVERNVSDRNRLDFLIPPDLMNALVVTGVQFQFLL